jgi:predicted ATPase
MNQPARSSHAPWRARLKNGHAELAEADFRDSIVLALSMGAKVWELRTTMSLARLLASQGRRNEARTMLADVYDWFTEGFEPRILRMQKALLDAIQQLTIAVDETIWKGGTPCHCMFTW